MPEVYSLLHETNFHEGVFEFQYSTPFACGTKKYEYAIDLNTFRQLNETRGTWRRIRRIAAVVTHGEPWTHKSKH